jgi:hypothetical protein
MSNRINKNSRKSAKVSRDDQGEPIDDDFQPVEFTSLHSTCTTCGQCDIWCQCDPEYEASLKEMDQDIATYCAAHGIPDPTKQGDYDAIQAILQLIEDERRLNALKTYVFPTPVVNPIDKADLAKPLAPVSAAPPEFNDRSTYAPTAADNKPFDPNEWVLSL